ncbi:MAG: hypothetical protein C5B50_27890 [Verrucomicrobia bacterium]|nr:MAG: hypothetical protein C5B50_27890 [Verrucomicrobiota bacterium]
MHTAIHYHRKTGKFARVHRTILFRRKKDGDDFGAEEGDEKPGNYLKQDFHLFFFASVRVHSRF